jgi:hypothetical protein
MYQVEIVDFAAVHGDVTYQVEIVDFAAVHGDVRRAILLSGKCLKKHYNEAMSIESGRFSGEPQEQREKIVTASDVEYSGGVEDELRNELVKIIKIARSRNMMEVYDCASDLIEEHPGLRNCQLFHLIIGSGVTESNWRELPFDIDGRCEKFVREKLSNIV